jgi:large subunit ribosomal protein L10
VVKNTLLKKAMQSIDGRDYSPLFEVLGGPTAVMFSEVGNVPAKLIQEFRRKNDKPLLKGAYIMEEVYTGDNNLDALAAIKSKNELIGDIIGLLQSPVQKVISGLTREDRKWAAE